MYDNRNPRPARGLDDPRITYGYDPDDDGSYHPDPEDYPPLPDLFHTPSEPPNAPESGTLPSAANRLLVLFSAAVLAVLAGGYVSYQLISSSRSIPPAVTPADLNPQTAAPAQDPTTAAPPADEPATAPAPTDAESTPTSATPPVDRNQDDVHGDDEDDD